MRRVVRIMVALLLSASGAWADNASDDAAYKALVGMMSIAPKGPEAQGCDVHITLDFSKFAAQIGLFREAFLNRDYSVDFYNQRRRQVFAYTIVKRAAELATEGLYNGHSQPECHFTVAADYLDAFGRPQRLQVATWRFNDAQAAKVDWDRFDPRDFADVAIDYRLDPAVTAWVSNEPDAVASARQAPACDFPLFEANAMFIRATAFCKKDYMDSAEGLAALAGARGCNIDDQTLRQRAKTAMLTLDGIARTKGRAAVCPFVEQVARDVRARMK